MASFSPAQDLTAVIINQTSLLHTAALNNSAVHSQQHADPYVPRNTSSVTSETVFPVNHLAGTSKTKPNYNQIQLTTQ